jgi:hypothetical protein
MARIQIVAVDNGVGNSKDITLVLEALAFSGHEVSVRSITPPERRQRRSHLLFWLQRLKARISPPQNHSFDLNIFLEHIYPAALSDAACHVLVPNPEWFDRHDERWLYRMTELWCKTRHTQQCLSSIDLPLPYIGFMSEDQWLPDVVKKPSFVHLAGKSRMKGTQALLNLWAKHPDWPTLTIIQSGTYTFNDHQAQNVNRIKEYLTEDKLRTLLNETAFHLCTSETEGWGHYIPEAMSMQSIVITLDAPPMNEHVDKDTGVLLQAQSFGQQHQSPLYRFNEASLIQWMNTSFYNAAQQWTLHPSNKPPQPFNDMGKTARLRFLEQRKQFIAHVNQRITGLLKDHNAVDARSKNRNHHSQLRS